MAGFLPTTSRKALLAALNGFLPTWDRNQPALNLPAPLLEACRDARDALAAADAAREDVAAQGRIATGTANEAAETARRTAAAVITAIRLTARQSADPAAVLNLGDITPATPAPRPAPLAPRGVSATLRNDGSVELDFTSSVAGTAFTVQRSLTGLDAVNGPWTHVALDGAKPFLDETLPTGLTQVAYRVRGVRGGKSSPWSEAATIAFSPDARSGGGELKLAA